MYVLKQIQDTIPRIDTDDFDQDPDVFESQFHTSRGRDDNENLMFNPDGNHRSDLIINLIKNDKMNNDNEDNSTWLFSKPAASSNKNPKMYILKRLHNTVQHIELDGFNQEPVKFNWKYDMHSLQESS